MPRLRITPRWRQSGVDYVEDVINVGRWGGRISFEALGHELAHYRLGHREEEGDPLGAFAEELEAWGFALSRAPEGEWDKLLVKTALEDYAEGVYDYYGEEAGNEAHRKIQALLRMHSRKFS